MLRDETLTWGSCASFLCLTKHIYERICLSFPTHPDVEADLGPILPYSPVNAQLVHPTSYPWRTL